MAAAKKTAVKKTVAAKKTATPIVKRTAPATVAAAPKATAGSLCATLLKTAGIALVAGETYAAFAERACGVLSDDKKFPQDVFAKLPAEITTWYDACIDPINTKQFDKLPELDGFPVTGDAPATAGKAAKAPKEPKAPREPKGPRTDSVAYKIRHATVMAGPDAVFEQVCKDAGVKGAERGNNAWNAYFNAIHVLRIAMTEKCYKVPAVKAAA